VNKVIGARIPGIKVILRITGSARRDRRGVATQCCPTSAMSLAFLICEAKWMQTKFLV